MFHYWIEDDAEADTGCATVGHQLQEESVLELMDCSLIGAEFVDRLKSISKCIRKNIRIQWVNSRPKYLWFFAEYNFSETPR